MCHKPPFGGLHIPQIKRTFVASYYYNKNSNMKKTFLLALVAMMCYNADVNAQAFLKGLKDKAVDRVKEKVTDKVDREVSNAADRVLDGKKKSNTKSAEKTEQTEDKAEKQEKDVTAEAAGEQKKSDYVPGAVTLFED